MCNKTFPPLCTSNKRDVHTYGADVMKRHVPEQHGGFTEGQEDVKNARTGHAVTHHTDKDVEIRLY
jgi:hypothetical protein